MQTYNIYFFMGDNAEQNFALVVTMEEMDAGISVLRANSKLSIQIFIFASSSSHLFPDKHDLQFCAQND